MRARFVEDRTILGKIAHRGALPLNLPPRSHKNAKMFAANIATFPLGAVRGVGEQTTLLRSALQRQTSTGKCCMGEVLLLFPPFHQMSVVTDVAAVAIMRLSVSQRQI